MTPDRRVQRTLIGLHAAADAIDDVAHLLPTEPQLRAALKQLERAIEATTRALDKCPDCAAVGDCECA